ncbi:hypothetical protein ACIQ9P_32045 [Kitasatospora sp. NPDC094019]|uniref:hypothetical protein n=1 Tax=Kitasatospora sp. NPDC094019 TaxID=3364091 RepID=UPI003809246D
MRTIRALVLTVLAALAALGPWTTGPASANTTGLDGTWSCTVPAGYVHDAIASGCGGSGVTFRLLTPATGRWSCAVPDAWTYDALDSSLGGKPYGPCQLGASKGSATRLLAPVDGAWVCAPPKAGVWTYDRISTTPVLSGCSAYGGNYHLRTPATGLWACTIPAGFTSSSTTASTDCRGYSHLLRRL